MSNPPAGGLLCVADGVADDFICNTICNALIPLWIRAKLSVANGIATIIKIFVEIKYFNAKKDFVAVYAKIARSKINLPTC